MNVTYRSTYHDITDEYDVIDWQYLNPYVSKPTFFCLFGAAFGLWFWESKDQVVVFYLV